MYPTPAHLDSCVVGGSGVILCLRRNDGVGVTSFIYHFDLAQVPDAALGGPYTKYFHRPPWSW